LDLSQWIERRAVFTPERSAIRYERDTFSYRDFAERTRALAAVLRMRLEVAPGDRVAYLGYNSPALLFLLFACARIGAVLVPLNWRLPYAEQRRVLADCEPRVLCVRNELLEAMPDDGGAEFPGMRRVALDAKAPGWESLTTQEAGCAADAPQRLGDYDAPVLICYTSGTTGVPKGAMLTQSALLWNAVNSTHMHEMTSADHVLSTLPMFHVGGLNIQTTPAFHAGAEVTLVSRFDPGETLALIEQTRPSLTVLVPAQLNALIAHPHWKDTDLSSLRAITTGSTLVPDQLIESIQSRGVPLIQVYGATETAPIASYVSLADAPRKAGSAGKPAVHCELRVASEAGQEAAPGERGEILVRGPNVTTGYWRNPEVSAQRLRDGWFHTEDIGHWDEEGFLHVDDRKKDMIISGGENIYPAEIEQILAENPQIIEFAVVGRPDQRWGEVPVAVVVPRSPGSLSREDVLTPLAGRLARYKHPKDVLFVEALPRNAMGKITKADVREMVAREAGAASGAGNRDRRV